MRLFLFLSMIIILNSLLFSQRAEELQSLISKADIPGISLIYIKDGKIRETYNLCKIKNYLYNKNNKKTFL